MSLVRKLRSKTRGYNRIIEVRVPVRFYWAKDGYDGFEFGPLSNCSRYERRLLNEVIGMLAYEHDCCLIAEYMRERHKEEWRGILDKIELEAGGIPKPFLDAFTEKGQ